MPDTIASARQIKRGSPVILRGLKRLAVAEKGKHESAPRNVAASTFSIVNVAQVRQTSPFRYPGGKTWLIPEVRRWVEALKFRPSVFVEPFAGGASVGLTAAVENLADQVVLCEKDADVAAVWKVVFGSSDADADWLFNNILHANLTEAHVRSIIESTPSEVKKLAFRTIIKNRCQHSGILAPGAGICKAGENGNGLLSRWYPQTLVNRMTILRSVRSRVQFIHGDAFDVLTLHARNPTAIFFFDPPYSLGTKKAGARLYLHHAVDHERLFAESAEVLGQFLMTYDDDPEVEALAERHNLVVSRVPMKSNHHVILHELVIKKK
jgi:DNA adenine methylase